MGKGEFDVIEEAVAQFEAGTRTESAALLAWFLAAVWRLEPENVDESICDGRGDKGIDGLWVDDDVREITIFQGKRRVDYRGTQGDAELQKLVGAAAYFESAEAVDGLVAAKPNPELLQLLKRLNIRDVVAAGTHATRLVFITNGELDNAGRDYVKARGDQVPVLDVWDQPRLAAAAQRTRHPDFRPETVTLTAATPPIALTLDKGIQMAVAVVPAQALVALPGIDDLSLFDRNVRLSVGRTRINNAIAETIEKHEEHVRFPAYHNGLTALTHRVTIQGNDLTLDGITVVNGCQSLLALHRKQGELTADLRVLLKVVETDPRNELADKITYRSNNQNPVDIRDQRSTEPVQRDLQAQVSRNYGKELAYEIREGEEFGGLPVLNNQRAAQLILAVYLKEPWKAVRKVVLFDEEYRRIFSRSVTGNRLYMLYLLEQATEAMKAELRPELEANFASVRSALAYLVSALVRESEEGRGFLDAPERWLPEQRAEVDAAFRRIAHEVIDSINFYVKTETEMVDRVETFDPKILFKSQKGVETVEREVLRDARRHAQRDPSLLFTLRPVR